MAGMTDMMVDIETTGTSADYSGLIQIAAIKFNHDTGEIGEFFDRCLCMAPNRFWDDGTRDFWFGKNRSVLNGIIARMEDPLPVLQDFRHYATIDAPDGGYRFWAKPIHFDYPIIASHFRQFGMEMPFHYRHTRDLNTYMAARAGGADHQKMEHISVDGEAHNALVDCVYQLKLLFAAKTGDFGRAAEDGLEYAEFTEVVA